MIRKIEKYDLCLGCGLCASVLGEEKCIMSLGQDGFYAPILKKDLSENDKEIIKKLCPGTHIEVEPHKGEWGPIRYICQSWSSNAEIRFRAASGGVVTSLAIFLLENHKVDAILHVGVRNDSYLVNELKISRTTEEIINNAQSRYAPALIFQHIKSIFCNTNDTFGFIGKPCDIAAMKNFLSVFPQYKDRIKYFISIFCAGIPSYNATVQAWKLSGHSDEPVTLKYRGDGWPGNFRATFKDGSEFQLKYDESWGKILGRQLGFRCKICPDGIGMLADIAVGDSWNTKNGYPDFTEADGKCFCMIRSEVGEQLMKDAIHSGYIYSTEISIDKIKEQQPYQYKRRIIVGWRLLPVQFVTCGLLNFRKLHLLRLALSANFKEGLTNLLGTYRRIKKISGQ